uniref:DB domain-containing protein n=1 Tax=Steinernema glaseri TaxID=37863 RepID=A0A1I8A2I4_9BILA
MSSSSIVAFSVLLLVAFHVSDACFSSGVCGGYGCAQPSYGCGNCQQGYGCGSYGCYNKARAASSKTLIATEEQQQKALTPDQKFMACCHDRNLPDACLQHCTFNTYTRDALQVESTAKP